VSVTDVGAADGVRTATVRGRRLRLRETGPADAGPEDTVLLLHGIGRSLEDWDEQHELLSDRFRVLSLDLPGYGGSEPMREPYALATLARAVEDALDALGVTGPVHVVGNSLGGAVAMQLSVQARSGCATSCWSTARASAAR
jgi:pimeloyl-ACP methyl ester carboxylesterase